MICASTWIRSIFLATSMVFSIVPALIALSDEPKGAGATKKIAEFQKWTSKDGRTTELALIAIEDEIVVMRDRAGNEFRLGIERFSDADKQRIETARAMLRLGPASSTLERAEIVSPRPGPWKTTSNLGEAQRLLALLNDGDTDTMVQVRSNKSAVSVVFTVSDDGNSIASAQVFGTAKIGGDEGLGFVVKFPTPIEIKDGTFSSKVGSSILRGRFVDATKVEGFARIVRSYDSKELAAEGDFAGRFHDVAEEDAERALNAARMILKVNSERGRDRLRELIKKWPTSEAAATAKELLETP